MAGRSPENQESWVSTAQTALLAALRKSKVPEEASARHLLSWFSYLVDPKTSEHSEQQARS